MVRVTMIGAQIVSTVGMTFVIVDVAGYGDVYVVVTVDVCVAVIVFGTGMTVVGFADEIWEVADLLVAGDFVTELDKAFEVELRILLELLTIEVLAV